MTDTTKITIRKGAVKYWSVYEQRWVIQNVRSVPANELAAMTDKARVRVIKAQSK